MKRVAVVTGSNQGIGFATVRALCKAFDGDVFLTARDESRGKAAVQKLEGEGLKPKFHQLDITDHNSIVRLKDFLQQNYNGLDVLVNNAALAYGYNDLPRPPIDEEAKEVLNVNFFSTLDLCEELFPLLRPHARVCNVSSIDSEMSFSDFSKEIKERVKDPKITMDGVKALMTQFVDATQKHQHEAQGFGAWPYGVSKVGLNLATIAQQKELDEKGADDIIVNACDPTRTGFVATYMSGFKGDPIDEGSKVPLYCVMLPEGVKSPRGKFINRMKIYNWCSG